MKDSFHPGASLLSKVFLLTRPFGNGKLAFVFLLSLLQGLFLGVGVSSIFPFLAVAADPAGIRESRIGLEFLGLVPEMSDQHLLLLAGAVSLTALLLSNAMSFLADYARARYASSYGHWLQVRLLREILRQPWPYFLQRNASVLAKKVGSDAAQFVSGVVIPLLDFAARAFTVIFLLALLVAMQPAIALTVGAVLCVFYLLVFRLLAEVRRRVSAGLLESGREGSKVLYDILCGVKVLKMHRSENAFLENFAEPSARSARLLTLSPLLAGGPRYVLEPVVFGCLILAVLIFSRGGQDLVAMLPTLGVVALAVYRLIPAMQLLYSNATTVHTNRHSVSEVYEEFVASNL
ncbi:MAG: ABC transporter transmembrane domain-containing protein, partial [Verrucomicrobiota bacterium]